MPSSRTTRLAATASIAAAAPLALASFLTPASADESVDRPSSFTSGFTVNATPDQVIDNDGNSAPGEEGATGTYTYMINSDEEIICYDITLRGVTPPYESPAKTATHIHEAAKGEAGPPRIAFPDPRGDGDVKTSTGCLQGPFTTGLEGDDGEDTGKGFTLSQIEDDPTGFTSDTHTADFLPGAVRGQLEAMPMGGVDTGLGGTADTGRGAEIVTLGALAALGVAGAATVVRRRVRA